MKKLWLLPLLFVLIASGCAVQQQTEDNALLLYFPLAEGESATGFALGTEEYTGTTGVKTMITALFDGPSSGNLESPFPSNIYLRSWRTEKGVLYLDFSEDYGGLSEIDLTVADYCVTMTMCQLSDVEAVHITVKDKELPDRGKQVLAPGDLLVDGGEGIQKTGLE